MVGPHKRLRYCTTLCEKCQYSEFFCSVFPVFDWIRTRKTSNTETFYESAFTKFLWLDVWDSDFHLDESIWQKLRFHSWISRKRTDISNQYLLDLMICINSNNTFSVTINNFTENALCMVMSQEKLLTGVLQRALMKYFTKFTETRLWRSLFSVTQQQAAAKGNLIF